MFNERLVSVSSPTPFPSEVSQSNPSQTHQPRPLSTQLPIQPTRKRPRGTRLIGIHVTDHATQGQDQRHETADLEGRLAGSDVLLLLQTESAE